MIKGTLLPERGHFLCLLKTWGLMPPCPPRFLRVTLSNLSPNLSRNVKKKDFSIASQGVLQQAICSMQLAMIVVKNSINTASANVWLQIVSQKPIGSNSASKYCETSCNRDVTLCNARKCVAAVVAKSGI